MIADYFNFNSVEKWPMEYVHRVKQYTSWLQNRGEKIYSLIYRSDRNLNEINIYTV